MKLILKNNLNSRVIEAKFTPHMKDLIASHAAKPRPTATHSTPIKEFQTKDGDVHPPTIQNRIYNPNGQPPVAGSSKPQLVVKVKKRYASVVNKDSPEYYKLPTKEPQQFNVDEQKIMSDRKPIHLIRGRKLQDYENQLNSSGTIKKLYNREEGFPETLKPAEDINYTVKPLIHGDERYIGRKIEMPKEINPTQGKILEVATFDGKDPFSYMIRQPYTGATRPDGYDGVPLDACTSFFADKVHKIAYVQSTWLTPRDAADKHQFKGK